MIPKNLHYCFGMAADFGGKPWGLAHYVCVKSAVERINPAKVYFWCEYVPKGPWWRLTEGMVDVVQMSAPREIFGNPLLHPAHRADVVRLEKLLEHGGIYLDADVFVHRDLDDLLHHSVILGEEERQGLCNAVILAEPGAPFLRRWHSEYRSFRSKGRDAFWGEHSVRVPLHLAKQFPGEITVLPPTAFYWPLWDHRGVDWIFNSVEAIPAAGLYANHLWETFAWQKYLRDLTPDRVRRIDSNFHFWARPMLRALPDNYGAPAVTSRAVRKMKRTASSLSRPGKLMLPYWHAANRAISSLFPTSKPARAYRQRTFRHAYDWHMWGSEEGRKYFSGVGSVGEPAEAYVKALAPIIAAVVRDFGEETTVVDLGCGDFRVGLELLNRLRPVRYIGCDIVPGLIAENIRQYGNERVAFRCLDIVSEDLPSGHVYLVRQVLQHLPNRDIAKVLAKLRAHEHVYVTEGQPQIREGPVNPDKPIGADIRFDWRTGRGRGVELDQPPYNLPVEEVCRASPNPQLSKEVIVTYRLRPRPVGRLARRAGAS